MTSDDNAPILIVCGRCEARVAAEVVGYLTSEADDPLDLYRIVVVRCPNCHEPLAARQEVEEDRFAGITWGRATRIWPRPENDLSERIPDNMRVTLHEARATFQVGAYDACAVMCRRALEELAQRFNAGGRSLYDRLEALNDAYVIDEQMLEWGHELRLEGNRGAHASDERVSREDADDMLEFTETICNFVFVLSPQFRDFKQRKESRERPRPTPASQ